MSTDREILAELDALADHLAQRREDLVKAWTATVEADPELPIVSSISLLHFRDLVPDVLESYEQRLRRGPGPQPPDEPEHQRLAEHGLHRWQQGYSLRELIREWGHLQLTLLDELERYGAAHPGLRPEVMPFARRLWVRRCGDGMTSSVEQYARLQRSEAEGVTRDLETALDQVKGLERRRAEAWYEAAHDLRGNVGVVTTTTSILTEDGVPEPLRAKALGTLQSSVSSLQRLLSDLMSLARLEAGREQRAVERFDAAVLLRELASTLLPMAHERGLTLHADGPESLVVEGDPVKVWRIVQNLALNALKYTRDGGVTIAWGETRESDIERWRIRVEDTGPGFHVPGAPLASRLREATASGLKVERTAAPGEVEPMPGSGAAPAAPSGQPPGEGIGLSIVKRLCELLEAGLEVSSEAGKGTVFQVVLPRRYPEPI